MEQNCSNCNALILENFCGNCGQKKFKRIDRKYIWDEIQYTLLHTNKGFLYSVKNILKNPGRTARMFIEGNRVNHYKPLLLVFVLSGFATFFTFKVLNFNEPMAAYYKGQHLESPLMQDVQTILSSYFSLLMLLMIPVFALATKIAFYKYGHNYFEHIVINAYVLCYYTLVSFLVLYPVLFILQRHSPASMVSFTQYSMLLVPLLLFWFFKHFYPEASFKSIAWRSLGAFGLTGLGYFLFILVAVVIGILYAIIMGPEAMEYIQAK